MANERAKTSEEVKYLVIVRTALSEKKDSLIKRIPKSYLNSSIEGVLNYVLDSSNECKNAVKVDGIRKEISKTGQYKVTVNGKHLDPKTSVNGLFEQRMHRGVGYQALEMNLEMSVASVESGG